MQTSSQRLRKLLSSVKPFQSTPAWRTAAILAQVAEEDFEHALRANLDSGARPSFTEVDARTIVPLEDFSAAARCQPSLSQLPDYISAGVQDCLKEANKSVKFVRNSGDFLTDRLKHATRSAGRGGIHSLDAHSPWQRPQTKNRRSWKEMKRDMKHTGLLDPQDDESEQLVDDIFQDEEEEVTPKTKKIKYASHETLGYAAARMPGCHAVASRVLGELRKRVPDFQPESLMDFGAGPGTAIWAANEVWPGNLQRVHAVESSPSMRWMGSKIEGHANATQAMSDSDENHGEASDCYAADDMLVRRQSSIRWLPKLQGFLSQEELEDKKGSNRRLRKSSKGQTSGDQRFDMVIASYSLGELDGVQEQKRALRALWKATSDILLIIEPGTPKASSLIRAVREQVLAWERQTDGISNCYVVAPCPHDGKCPMDGKATWCHFQQRFERQPLSRFVKIRKNKPLPRSYQDERFSYVMIRRGRRPNSGTEIAVQFTNLNGQGWGVEYDSPDDVEWDEVELQADDEQSTLEEEIELVDIETELEPPLAQAAVEASQSWSRIIRPPRKRVGHTIFDVCAASGELEQYSLGKSERKGPIGPDAFKVAKKLEWGDLLPTVVKEQCKRKDPWAVES